ncbi:MAG: amino acid adenylation domain-containing protein, partial [Scytonema sp. PMC 1069.18]|nr:amino acid adenylation domain-containing protein [Scytonema sp. PMC 1069.18]
MTLVEFLNNLSAQKIELWVEGDKLRYRAPQEALSPTLLSEIKKYKEEIILLLQKRTNPDKIHHLVPTARDVQLPLSFAQQRVWFFTQMEPDSAFYNIPSALRLHGELQVAFLEQSFSQVMNRHEALRTNFIIQNGQPIQIIHPPQSWKLSVLDWRKLPKSEQEVCWEQFAIAQAQHPFNLAAEPLVRATLIQLSEKEHILLICLHHIVADGWSRSIFIRELATFYSAFYHGQTLSLPELPIQYADYAVWQRQWLQGDVLESQLAYWKQQLANAPTLLSLPSDRPRPAVQTFRGRNQSFAFSKELGEALKLLSQREGATLFMTLLTAFNILLYRYAGQEDILVGSPIANRSRHEVEALIGFFVNTLVLRTDLSGNPSFRELLSRVKATTLAAYSHQDVPFELLVDALVPERDLSHTPLFQVMFALQNTPVEKMELAGLTVNSLVIENKTSKFDLTLSVESTHNGLVGWWEYSTDLFDDATITRMIGHFQTLLEGIVANPNQNISQLPLLTSTEQHQLLVEWNNTQVYHSQDLCLHQWFESQVEQTPNAVAVVFEGQHLTYRELNLRANRLAHYLQKLGVQPEVLVGICVQQSFELVIGILGILKAGGAYVPLDARNPQNRLAFILQDAQVSLLLTQQDLVQELPEYTGTIVQLDTDWQDISQEREDNPNSGVVSSNLAYVIYTSGSTGQPKGVLVNHANVTRLFASTQSWYNFSSQDVWTLFHSYAFDFSVWEIWGALLYGGQLVIVPYIVSRSPEAFYDLLSTHKVTVLNQTPSAFYQFMRVDETRKVGELALRLVIFGGEALEVQSLKPMFERYGEQSPQLVNMYGITETTVHVTYRPLSKADLNRTTSVIGRPIRDVQVYVLDRYQQPVPIGVTGEMYIGGAGVARGYLNRPELTSQKFISNPFVQNPAAQLYRSGDLARYRSNGDIEYLGRIDNQVKIRGFRIELGEIETVLSQHPALSQTVVIVREDVPGDKRLVAYLVPHQNQKLTIFELHRFLKNKLSNYMIPSAFVFLEALPLTPNGKIDRNTLPAPESPRELNDNFVAPQHPIEQMLALIWAEVLRVESVGIHDNFFELGGDSILSLQAIAKANQVGIHLTPKQLFNYQTIAELTTVAGTTQTVQAEQGLVTGSLPLTPIQHWFFEQNLSNPAHFNQSILLEVPTNLKPELLEQVLQQLLQHHDALRLRFVQKIPYWEQSHAADAGSIPLKVVDISEIVAENQPAAIEVAGSELQTSLNLSCGPLMKAALFYLGSEQPSRLLLIIHHLAVDGVSWRILLEDLFNAYQQISQGQAIQLPSKTSSFSDWAHRLTKYGQSAALKAELNHWLNHLGTDYTPLPKDYQATPQANTVASSSRISVALSLDETRALLQEVPSAYNTQINDVLLTALLQTFAKWTGQNSLLVDLEGHGREELFEDIDLSRTIGWFTSLFPVRLQLEDANNPGTALKLLKEQLRRLTKRGIGYGILRYLIRDENIRQQLQTLPNAEISFNYLGQFHQELLASAGSRLGKESGGALRSPLGYRTHLLEVDGMVVEGQLQINWTYSQNFYKHATIENLAQEYIKTLQQLITHCLSPEAGGYTSSDFPLAQLTQEELEQVLTHLLREKEQTNWKNIEKIYPLSPTQEGMLFHSLYAPQSGVYFEQFLCTLKGNLNVQAFEQAWLQIVTRHSVFRTAFLWGVCDRNLQIVYREVKISVKVNDWRSLSYSEQQEQLKVFLELEQNLSLDRAPIMRLTLIQLSDRSYQFVWAHHHALLDGWSLSLVLQEVFTLYHEMTLHPGLTIGEGENLLFKQSEPYCNYIAWLQKQDLASAEIFWKERLHSFSAPTPVARTQTSIHQEQHPIYSTHEILLTEQAIATLESFARQHQLTVNTLVQGAWALLLNRYSRETDVVFGVTVSGRPPVLVGVESMVGLFINTLPIRVQVSENVELLPWLKSLQTQQVESEQYSYTALVDIHKWSEIPQGIPLFESLIVFDNYPVDTTL